MSSQSPYPGLKRPGDDGQGNFHSPNKALRTQEVLPGIESLQAHAPSGFGNDITRNVSIQSPSYGVHQQAPSSTRKRPGASHRTGQACDRCKQRKIKCDARPGGCSPCMQNNLECKTTDRVTGRATSRGYTENMENENANLKMYMLELQQQLRDHGIEPKVPPVSTPAGYSTMASSHHSVWQHTNSQSSPNQLYSDRQHEREEFSPTMLSDFRPGCTGDNYLGVSSERSWLTMSEGLNISLFGIKIDLGELLPPEDDPSYRAMSYQTFVKHAYHRAEPMDEPELPPYEQCKVYSEWFFRSLNPFIPLLHRPQFFDLLERVVKNGEKPTTAEKVIIHMVITVINFQYAFRNNNAQAKQDSFRHFHYCLTFISDLTTSHQLQDIQALAMICHQLRCFPRPGAAWTFIHQVLNLAIEMGLHRTAKAWEGETAEKDPHTIEMRKRIFWSLLIFAIVISGKLGRPMPLQLEEFDIEIPDAIADSVQTHEGLPDSKKCSIGPAIKGMALLKIIVKIYSSVYSIHASKYTYEANLKALERELQEWKSTMPPELAGGIETIEEDRIGALYLDISMQECRLILHHPSLCRSSNPEVMSHNLDVCLETSSRMLYCASQLRTLKSLDTTWQSSTNFMGAIVTTLFAYTERSHSITQTELQRLKQDMELWVDILGEVGQLLQIGGKLQVAMKGIIDVSLDNISRRVAAKTAEAVVKESSAPATYPGHRSGSAQEQHGFSAPSQPFQTTHAGSVGVHELNNNHGTRQPEMPNHQSQDERQARGSHSSQFQSRDRFAYPEPPASHMNSYGQPQGDNPYHLQQYQQSPPKAENIEDQLSAAMSQVRQSQTPQAQPQLQIVNHSSNTTGSQPYPQLHVSQHPQYPPYPSPGYQQAQPSYQGFDTTQQPGPAAWRHFTDAMVTSVPQSISDSAESSFTVGQQMPMSSASLIANGVDLDMAALGTFGEGQGDATSVYNRQWPLIVYNYSEGDGMGAGGNPGS
ncbi:hypothetical protein K431DRAFT_282968 [Polychaeton citri CBS 116435]|uniref:Zn(2)-C6 fungal-type domain-containing protein n=1 Tax=Polychaeton citri CBS 116435 TaxID=1314669 RepID=A0A9P4UR41_9PEZI|nr:hypothetical protein K431DRAFT_282968 [Polychaeton citri CBS 116435]